MNPTRLHQEGVNIVVKDSAQLWPILYKFHRVIPDYLGKKFFFTFC